MIQLDTNMYNLAVISIMGDAKSNNMSLNDTV